MAMELDHSFTVPVPPDQAWDVLLDVQRIAPCMPGATVDTVDGDDVAGRLKVKVGPVSLTYKGTATFKERDSSDRSLLVEASGKELRGAGNASATVRAALQPDNEPDATLVTLHTTLSVTGRPAQFGRGVIAEVGSRLIDKFADNLAQQLSGGADGAAASDGAEPTGTAGAGTAGAAGAEPTGTAAAESAPVETASVPAPSPSSDDTAAATAIPPAPRLAPVHPLSPPPPPPAPVADNEDSLNLLSIAGPVLAKRVAPVAGAITGVVVITWLIRRVRRRKSS
jgi:carbon monoxide dehydrogenase subunit G